MDFLKKVIRFKCIWMCVFLYLAGCSTTNTLPAKEFRNHSTDAYVPITLFIDDGTRGSNNAYPYDRHIYERFQASGLFQQIGTSSKGWPYTIFVEFNVANNGDALSDAAFIASAATLFIVPTKADFTYTMKITVKADDAVKVYRYMDRIEYMSSILDADGHVSYETIDNLLNHFFEELQTDTVLPKADTEKLENKGSGIQA